MRLTRQMLAKNEVKSLAPYAVKSVESEGRVFKEKKERDRLCFQKDKERIIHSKAFRRLDKKTQVFISGSGDHFRTRLTHTLEVAQMSRDIARRLGLNEDLAEAIALAHDLGHPPFGHAGEEALDEIMKEYGEHFEHNEQSRLVVEKLEKSYPEFDGLNLTVEVLDGLIKHQSAWDQAGKKFDISASLEAQIVNIADEIAYTNHDIDDGIRSGLIQLKDLRKLKLWKIAEKIAVDSHGEMNEKILIPRVTSQIISLMIEDLCFQTDKNLKKFRIKTVEDVRSHKGVLAMFSPNLKKIIKDMSTFLYKNVYMHKKVLHKVEKGKRMIKKLFVFYMKNSRSVPHSDEKKIFRVKNYIAGMTDNFLIKEYEKFIIKSK